METEDEEEEVELLQPDSKPKPDPEASKDEGVDDSQSWKIQKLMNMFKAHKSKYYISI